MATYIALMNYTDEGIRNVRESPSRLDTARKRLSDLGGELKTVYLTMGGYDLVAICEAPSSEVMTQFALATGSLGNVRTTTLTAFTEAEFRDIITALP